MTKMLMLPLIILLSASVQAQRWKLIDREATAETKALHKNLKKLSRDHTLFGHQAATEYGRGLRR